MPNICILGLGNPDLKYNGTRHNIGKDWVIKIAKELKLDLQSNKKMDSTTALSEDKKILWGFPNLYVNESGKSINKIMRNANFNLEQMIVIHDDLDLEIGTMRIKVDGGHGGHNGLKSIINLSGKSFVRLRVGIGHPGNKTDVTNWVLGKFKPAEIDSLIESYYKFNHIIELLGDNKVEQAQLQLHSG